MKHDHITMDAARTAWAPSPARAPSVGFERFVQGQLLADAWTRLEQNATLPTQGLGFVTALSRSLLAGTAIEVFFGRGGGVVQALIPLCRGKGVFPRWRLAGACEVFEPGDALCDGPQGALRLAQALANDRHPLVLDRIPAGSAMVDALRGAMRGRGLVSVRPAAPSPYITLGPAWRTPEACFNAGRRSDFRRAARRAMQMGPVFYEVIAPGPQEFDALFDEAMAVEALGWKGKGGSAMARDPAKQAFFRAWLHDAATRGTLRIAFMRIGRRAVAMQMALVQAKRFWLLKIGYDEGYRACSPGNLLMLHTVGHAAREGLAAYELLGAMEPWIADLWTRESHACLRVRTYPFSLRGGVALVQDGALWLGGRLARRAS